MCRTGFVCTEQDIQDMPQSPPFWSVTASSSGVASCTTSCTAGPFCIAQVRLLWKAIACTLCLSSLGIPSASLCTLLTQCHLSVFVSQNPVNCTDCTRLCSVTSAPAALQALQDSPAYDSFLKRWKLSVYFSLRFQVSHFSGSCVFACIHCSLCA